MKKYIVIVTPEAEEGIRESFRYIQDSSPQNAELWIRQLYAEIDTLEEFPERCMYARERDYLEEDLRQLIFKSHRVIFQVDNTSGTVFVLYVRHSSRRAVGEPE